MSASRSGSVRNFGLLVTLPDGQQATYDAIIQEARKQRSAAMAAMIRSLLGLDSNHATRPLRLHRRFWSLGHRRA